MQVVYKNKDEKSNSRGADLVGTIICAERNGGYLEGKYIRGLRREIVKI